MGYLRHLIAALPLAGAAYAAPYHVGVNLLVNGDFARNSGTDAVGWTRNIQFAAKAVVHVVPVTDNPSLKWAAELFFTEKDGALQARYYQSFPVKSNTVYELTYWYRSDADAALNADIMLTGTGPLYRNFHHNPASNWTRVRRLFATPLTIDGTNAGIYVQNRSAVPLRYAGISLCETDIAPAEMAQYAPSPGVHSVTPDDALILPGNGKSSADFVIDGVEAWPDSAIRASYVNGDGREFAIPVSNRVCRIPTDAVTDGKSQLYVSLADADGTVIASGKTAIERISESEMPETAFSDKSPCMKGRDGLPLLVVGMYGVTPSTPSEELRELAANGFNFIHSYSFDGNKDPKTLDGFLRNAADAGLKCMVGLPRHLAEKKGMGSELEDWIRTLDASPETIFYYEDETHSIRKSPIELFSLTHEIVAKASGGKRLFLGYDPPEKSLAPHLDGFLWGFASPAGVKLARIRTGSDKILIHVFGQAHYDQYERLVPEAEIRYNFFMPIILGVRGVFYWWYPAIQWRHKYRDELKAMLFKNARELSALVPLILSGEPLPADAPCVTSDAADGSVYSAVFAKGGEAVAIVGRDRNAAGVAATYLVNPAGFAPVADAKPSGDIAPGEIAVLHFRR